ncbi:hypothetical protein AB4Y45_32185 [Paraburkholderia sp. EG287A]|uniref:hypothetical protein n=1 Tax=Paraburkholderia sp. EG287A TaxID=3237012 RepID=UPI0034D31B3C
MSQEMNVQADLQKEQQDLDRFLAQTNGRIGRITNERTSRLVAHVDEMLPALKKRVLRVLENEYPDFLTNTRRLVFAQHGNWFFGLFERSTTRAQLQQLRVQFRAHLEQTDFCAEMDDELRRLANQRVNLTRELQNVTRLLASTKRVNVIPGERPSASQPAHSVVYGTTGRGMSFHRAVQQDTVIVYDNDDGDDGFANGMLLAAIVDSQPDQVVVVQDGSAVLDSGPVGNDGASTGAVDSGAGMSDFVATAAAAADAGAPDACVIDTNDSLGAFS